MSDVSWNLSLLWAALPPLAVGPAAALLALGIDRCWGEPAARWHPVVWMGTYLAWAGQRISPLTDAVSVQPRRAFWRGALAWSAGALTVWLLCWAVASFLAAAPGWLQALALGFLLKPMLAWRMLREEVRSVEVALGQSLAAGREQLARLVSRDVDALDTVQVRESAIETLAENLNDSVVAPLFWFAVAGLPGAAVYRFANTADAMWGYRGERHGRDWTWADKWAARADDALSWAPARITAVLLMAWGRAVYWKGLVPEAGRTPSPNSGWPMAAMALVLGVQLGKPGAYTLNAQGRRPEVYDTARAIRVSGRVVCTLAGVAVLWCLSWALLSVWVPGAGRVAL